MTTYKVYLTVDKVLKENGLTQFDVYTHGGIRAGTFGQYYNNRVARADLAILAEILRSINELTDKEYSVADLIRSERIEN